MSDNDLTKQDEDLSAAEYIEEEFRSQNRFGNWPEVVGLIFTAFVCWLIFNFRG